MAVRGFAVSSWVWSSAVEADNYGAFGKASGFGFEGIEIPTMDGSLDSAAIRNALNSISPRLTPIIIGGGLPHTDLSSEDPSIAKNGLDYVKRCVKMCADIGGSLTCGPLYSAVGSVRYLSGAEREKTLQRVILSFKDLGDFARDLGVSIALEPLCRYDTHLLNTAAQMYTLVEKIDRENVGILLDTFHMNIEEKSFNKAIATAGKKLMHFHACENDRGTPGTGLVNWNAVSESLRTANYEGWIVIESFTPYDPNFSQAMRVWRSLETTQDEIATKGLAFLKTKFS